MLLPTISLENFKLKKKKKKTQAELSRALDYRNKKADSDWRIVFFFLRIVWAAIPLLLLVAIAAFTFWLVSGVGRGELDFKGYELFLNIIAGNLLVYALGLVYIIMNFLFPRKSEPSKPEDAKTQNEEDLFDIPALKSD